MRNALEAFAKEEKFFGKGPLSVALVVTDLASKKSFPLAETDFITDGGGQVYGLGKSAVQAILKKHDIDRVLAAEGGRTSRNSLRNMKAYVAFLNRAHQNKFLDLKDAERFWIERVRAFFSGKPLTLRVDAHFGMRMVIRQLMDQAKTRQAGSGGAMVVGTVMQHLVGAKLELALGTDAKLEHHSSNQSDQKPGRTGDFDIGYASIHVTNAPTEALLQKCRANLAASKKPIIITGYKGTAAAEGLAENLGIADSVDIIEFEQFIATNIHELGGFDPTKRNVKIGELIDRYNDIVDTHETDPSLKIEIASGK